MDKDLPVSVWPEWKIVEKIGEGSFGKVYKAQRTEWGRSFYSAIKIITIPANKSELNSVRQESGDENDTREYFRNIVEECIQEISTMEYFRGNSHIVSVEDFKVVEYLDEIGWDIYIRMEYLTSFLDYCAGREMGEKEVLKLGCDLCRAMDHCRQLNIIHRDIKPENIFVSRFGDFKLGDFGIARELEQTMSSMSKKGTYSYMAPEMYRGESYDARVDVYSLGIVLYKLMNRGRLPFLSLDKQLITYRDKEVALNKRMAGEPVPAPADASPELARVIQKACAYDEGERYENAAQFYRALDDLIRKEERSSLEGSGEGISHTYPAYPEQDGEKTNRAPSKRGYLSRYEKKQKIELRILGKGIRRYEISLWRASAVLVMAVACLVIGVYAKKILDQKKRVQDSQMIVRMLESNDNSTAQIDDFSTTIQNIKKRVTSIVELLPRCSVVGKEGERLRYYDENGKLVKALIYPETSDDGVYEEYYYWEERLFFAYAWTNTKQELYYYDQRGKLIRWIDQDGTIHDKETDSTEYTKRGEKYWKVSLKQFD
ncbi:MAG: serine/threonine-protein kinase [Eubacteriales bacterium]|nr:serine/threonine-protein kinase [Eubacteriales bacterium]